MKQLRGERRRGGDIKEGQRREEEKEREEEEKGRTKRWKEQDRDGWYPTTFHPLDFAIV